MFHLPNSISSQKCLAISVWLSMQNSMSVRLYVGNLSFDFRNEDLRDLFSVLGNVEDAVIVTRSGTRRSRGFGFVTLDSESAAHEAIRQLHGQAIAGRKICVNIAEEPVSASSVAG
jgi:RNA recognition motif-containing protein